MGQDPGHRIVHCANKEKTQQNKNFVAFQVGLCYNNVNQLDSAAMVPACTVQRSLSQR